jgi:hypothetical protein
MRARARTRGILPARSRKKPAAKLTNKNEKAGHTWEPAGVAKAAARWGERTQDRERREVGRPQGRENARELPDTTYRLVQTGFDDGDLGVVRRKTRHAVNRCKGARDQHLKGKTLVDRWPIGWPSEVVFFSAGNQAQPCPFHLATTPYQLSRVQHQPQRASCYGLPMATLARI